MPRVGKRRARSKSSSSTRSTKSRSKSTRKRNGARTSSGSSTSVSSRSTSPEQKENYKTFAKKTPRGIKPQFVPDRDENMYQLGWLVALATYFSYAILIIVGRVRDLFGKMTGRSRFFKKSEGTGQNANTATIYTTTQENGVEKKVHVAPLISLSDNFYLRRLYARISDCWNRPITGYPSAGDMIVLERKSKDGHVTFEFSGKETKLTNLGSYNYLGFADDWQESCKTEVEGCLTDFGASRCSALAEGGTTALHRELEEKVAAFVGKEAALVMNMGYATNSNSIPAILGPGSLIVSDSCNHTSIVNGARASGAFIRVFRHDDTAHLEQVLRQSIIQGQPRTHRPWKKILVMVEGIYSMEGEISSLPEIVRVAKKYKAYLYVDEAHSIGALGPTGRGVCEYTGVNPDDIDILMGTFTKSFGAMGGYIAGSRDFIEFVRSRSVGALESCSLSPVCAKQIIRAIEVISGEDGTKRGKHKLDQLRENSNFFRKGLTDLGCQVYGDSDSPIIPVMLYCPAKIGAFSRECYKRGLAVVVVGFPATPLMAARARFCISAGHTREQLEHALVQIGEVCDLLNLRYAKSSIG